MYNIRFCMFEMNSQFGPLNFDDSTISVWLCCKAESPRPAGNDAAMFSSSHSLSYFGIFTDDPAAIAVRLGRPRTPFVPAPTHVLPWSEQWVGSWGSAENVDDSPRAGFGSPRFASAHGVNIF
jgi:hypothetical protein